jgi:hypothetical protein
LFRKGGDTMAAGNNNSIVVVQFKKRLAGSKKRSITHVCSVYTNKQRVWLTEAPVWFIFENTENAIFIASVFMHD